MDRREFVKAGAVGGALAAGGGPNFSLHRAHHPSQEQRPLPWAISSWHLNILWSDFYPRLAAACWWKEGVFRDFDWPTSGDMTSWLHDAIVLFAKNEAGSKTFQDRLASLDSYLASDRRCPLTFSGREAFDFRIRDDGIWFPKIPLTPPKVPQTPSQGRSHTEAKEAALVRELVGHYVHRSVPQDTIALPDLYDPITLRDRSSEIAAAAAMFGNSLADVNEAEQRDMSGALYSRIFGAYARIMASVWAQATTRGKRTSPPQTDPRTDPPPRSRTDPVTDPLLYDLVHGDQPAGRRELLSEWTEYALGSQWEIDLHDVPEGEASPFDGDVAWQPRHMMFVWNSDNNGTSATDSEAPPMVRISLPNLTEQVPTSGDIFEAIVYGRSGNPIFTDSRPCA